MFPTRRPAVAGGCGVRALLWHALDNLPLWAEPVFYAKDAVRIVRNYITLPWLDFFRSLGEIHPECAPAGAPLLLAPFVMG